MYAADDDNQMRDAVLIIPGGAYFCVCADREGEPVALRFVSMGVNAFVLNYTVADKGHQPQLGLKPLADTSMAMAYIRNNAQRYRINPGRVFAIGFSAGAHLAGSLATLWHLPKLRKMLPDIGEANRPDGVVLCYSVVTMGEKTEVNTRHNIAGEDEELRSLFSLEHRVDSRTPPMYIMHTSTDAGVPAENALLMASACAAAGVKWELHVWSRGEHGIALADETTWRGRDGWRVQEAEEWPKSVFRWMQSQKDTL